VFTISFSFTFLKKQIKNRLFQRGGNVYPGSTLNLLLWLAEILMKAASCSFSMNFVLALRLVSPYHRQRLIKDILANDDYMSRSKI